MNKLKQCFLFSVLVFFLLLSNGNAFAIDIVTSSGVWYRDGSTMKLNPATLGVQVADLTVTGTLTFSGAMGSDFDLDGYAAIMDTNGDWGIFNDRHASVGDDEFAIGKTGALDFKAAVDTFTALAGSDITIAGGDLNLTGDIVATPSATGTQDILNITPSQPLDAGSIWVGMNIDGSALDPATGSASTIVALNADFSGVASTDGNANILTMNFQPPAADSSTGYRIALTELTADENQVGFKLDGGSLALSATGTYEGLTIDWASLTRDGGAPVLEGVTVDLPADYTNFGTNYAAKFTGDGRTVTINDTTYALDVSGLARFDNRILSEAGINETASRLSVKQTPSSATTNTMVTLEADGANWSGGGVLKIISDDSSAIPFTITDGTSTTSQISRTGTISLNNHVELLAGGDVFTTANGDLRLLPNGWGHTVIETEDALSAVLMGNATKMGPLESVTRNGTTTLTKVSHGLSLGNGDLVQIESANGQGFYRLVSFTGDTLVVDRVVAGSASDVQLTVWQDVISFFDTDGTNGNWMRGNSHQDKPLQIGGDTLKATSGLGSEDVVMGGNLGIGEVDFAESAGAATLSRMNIAAGGTAGDEMSVMYSMIEDQEGVKHYCEDDSAGGAQNCEIRLDKLSFSNDGTKTTIINTGMAQGDYLRIGDAAATSQALASEDDLLVTGKLEVDGESYFESQVTHTANILAFDNIGFLFGTGSDAVMRYSTTLTPDGLLLGVGADNNALTICEIEDRSLDFAHPLQTNPTIFLQSADGNSTMDYLGMAHDQSDVSFKSGLGGFSFGVDAQKAEGTMTLTGLPVADETFVINATTITAKADGSGDVDWFTIGGTAAATVTNIVATILESSETANVKAWDGTGDTVVFEWKTGGTAGNAIVFTEALTNVTVDGAGTLGTTHAGVAADTLLTLAENALSTFGGGVFIDENTDRIGLEIDSEATTFGTFGLQVTTGQGAQVAQFIEGSNRTVSLGRPDTSTAGDNWFFRDLGSANTAGPVGFFEQDNTGDDQIVLKYQQDGTGGGFFGDCNGAGICGAFDHDDTGTATTIDIDRDGNNAATITGQTINVANAGAGGAIGQNIALGELIYTPTSDQTLANDAAVTCSNPIARVAGDGAAVVLDTDPAVNDGSADGAFCIIQGTSDANTVTIADAVNTALAGGAAFVGGQGDMLTLAWDSGDSIWYEISRSDN